MSTSYKPDFKFNILGCLEKYGDIEGALKWFTRAEKDLSDEEFVELVDTTIESRYRRDLRFSQIFTLRDQKRMVVYGMKDIEAHLEDYRFKEADELYRKNKHLLNEAEFKELTQKYWIKKCTQDFKYKIITQCPMGEEEALSIAHLVVEHDPGLGDNFSWGRLKAFIVGNMDRLDFPQSIYLYLLEGIANGIKRDTDEFDKNTLTVILKRVLAFPDKGSSQYENVWTVLCAHPSILKKFSTSHKRDLDELADSYPFEDLVRLSPFYSPPEISCLDNLKNGKIPSDNTSYAQLKSFFQKNRYFNCEIILALLKAKDEQEKLNLKNILDYLRIIVNRVFDYNLESKIQIPNLIFPGCISDYKSKNFQISEDAFVFCEGIRLKRRESGENYMLCRKQQCNERTDLLNVPGRTQSDNYFFSFLDQEFDISSEEIFSNEDFARAMCAFNRWNEIAERLICGYGDTMGCGSSLIYSKSLQVNAGWAAYATTYWRCSNPSCPQVEMTIKLSHCAGCEKIIDSRFDKISCGRLDRREFFICIDCGYCCNEHEVSGICPNPKCGQKKGWESLDRYGKRYRCLACGHEIAVPNRYKGCLGSPGARNVGKIRPRDPSGREELPPNYD